MGFPECGQPKDGKDWDIFNISLSWRWTSALQTSMRKIGCQAESSLRSFHKYLLITDAWSLETLFLYEQAWSFYPFPDPVWLQKPFSRPTPMLLQLISPWDWLHLSQGTYCNCATQSVIQKLRTSPSPGFRLRSKLFRPVQTYWVRILG